MNVIFHYYVVDYLCKKAGFAEDEICIIANSSAYIDHSLIDYKIDTKQGIYNFSKTKFYEFWDKELAEDILPVFHFFPGDIDHIPAKRKDGIKNAYNTTPASSQVKEFLIEALKSKNMYRIGIALHTFMDSFAHQNFSGKKENWNAFYKQSEHLFLKSFFNHIIVPVGHMQAGWVPDDYFCKSYLDIRLDQDLISNSKRFLDATKRVYKYLCAYKNKDYSDCDSVILELQTLLDSCKNADNLDENQPTIVELLKKSITKKALSTSNAIVDKAKEKSIWLVNKIKEKTKVSAKTSQEYTQDDEEFSKFDNSVDDANLFAKYIFESQFDIKPYNPFLWQDDALDLDIGIYAKIKSALNLSMWGSLQLLKGFKDSIPPVKTKGNFFYSDFYFWSEAVKEQKKVYKIIQKNL